MVAADPSVVPLGSVIRLTGLSERYNGLYSVMDTGSAIRGRRLDVFMRDCDEAVKFGRQPVDVTVVRRGWNPRTTF